MTVAVIVGEKRHSLTVPRHRSLSPGTLNAIISAVAEAHEVSRHEVRQRLLG